MSKTSQPRQAPIVRPRGSVAGFPQRDRKLADAELHPLISELAARVHHSVQDGLDLSGREIKWLGMLAAELDSLCQTSASNRFSARKSLQLLDMVSEHPDFSLEWLAGRECLEVGCGGLSPLGGMFPFLLAGAGRCTAVDLDSVVDASLATRALYTCLTTVLTRVMEPVIPHSADEILRRLETFDLQKLAVGDYHGIDQSRIWFRQSTLQSAGFSDASVDLMGSISFLEHPDDPGDIIAEMARIARPGAIATHAIDGVDHRIYADPKIHELEFLEIPDEKYSLVCNRIRPLAFPELFESHGFEVRKVQKTRVIEVPDEMRSRFIEPFRSMSSDMLECSRAIFHVRKR